MFETTNLSTVDVVVWLNTSGNGLLTRQERKAFETFIENGGGFVGVHAATDTYRDGSWEWYNHLVGGIVQENPNHTDNNYQATMTIVGGGHPALEHIGEETDTWEKKEEYYYWERNGGMLYDDNINLLEVESTGNKSYDKARPITWYKYVDNGRSFYTALGHNKSDYEFKTGDDEHNRFITMVEESIKWAGGLSDVVGPILSVDDASHDGITNSIHTYPNPCKDVLTVSSDDKYMHAEVKSLTGQLLSESEGFGTLTMDLNAIESGMYVLQVMIDGQVSVSKLKKK